MLPIFVFVHTGKWIYYGEAVLLAYIRLIEFLQYSVAFFPD
jgi:hypothetical protein